MPPAGDVPSPPSPPAMMDRGTVHVSAPSLHAHAHMTALTAPSLPQRSPFAIQELLGLGSQSDSPPAPPASSSFGAGGSLGAAPHLLYSRHAALAAHQQHSLFPDSRHVWMNHALLPGMGMGGLGAPVTPVTVSSGMPSMLGLRHDAHAPPPDAHSPGKPYHLQEKIPFSAQSSPHEAAREASAGGGQGSAPARPQPTDRDQEKIETAKKCNNNPANWGGALDSRRGLLRRSRESIYHTQIHTN